MGVKMKVTPTTARFLKHDPGQEFDLNDKLARAFIRTGKLQEVQQVYQTRDLQPARPEAPYGYKADGTPRQRPGRLPRSKE
jgi:hypothetical protein